jgi:2-polyprenyl-3-methyl-5-hydroxy-6-metoxy-1,4-benzoquinol methylase
MNVLGITARIASKACLSRFLPPPRVRYTIDQWEAEYAHGEWERLRKVEELPHYSVIAGYVSHFADCGRILDVGCGEGILQELLGKGRYSRYLGIDLARDAILKASRKQDERTTFEQADAVSYTPRENFDVIVFNEVLYYFDAPTDLMAQYTPWLGNGGRMIVSMVFNRRSHRIWKMLDRIYGPEAEVLIANRSADWIVKSYRGG